MSSPILANWIRFKKIDEEKYLVRNLLTDEKFYLDSYMVWFAKKLNGKRDPDKIDRRLTKEDVDYICNELEEKNIVRERQILSKSIFEVLLTLWMPRVTNKLRLVSFLLNSLLLIFFIPMFVFSIYLIFSIPFDFNMDYIFIGSIVGIILGMVLHELGHMFACLSYGGYVFELGLMLNMFVPGAYVLMNEKPIKKKMHRIQVSAAGIEMNIMLSAFCLMLCTLIESLSGFFLGMAINNVFLALVNMTFIRGFDGSTIISELLGVEDVIGKAKRVIKSKRAKKILINKGVLGKGAIACCYILRTLQITLPILLLLNVVGVVTWFV